METKHTKGPWELNKYNSICSTETQKQICIKGGISMTMNDNADVELANAKLIASAPELLEALILANKLITGWIPAESENHLKIKNAIKKATE